MEASNQSPPSKSETALLTPKQCVNTGPQLPKARPDAAPPTTTRRRPSSCKRNDSRLQSGSGQRPSGRNRPSTSTSTSRQDSITIIKTRGYSICRTPSTVEMNINTNAFFENDEMETSGPPNRSSAGLLAIPNRPRSATTKALEAATQKLEATNLLTLDLQTGIRELKLEQEKEREEHKEEIEKLQVESQEEKEATRLQHKQELCECIAKQVNQVAALQVAHKEQIQEIKIHQFKEEVDLKAKLRVEKEEHASQIAELQNVHETETENLKERMQKEHEEEMIVLEGALRKDSKEEVRQAKDEMVRKQKHELERIQEQHEHELENVLQEFSKLHELEEELEENKKQVKKLERQSSKLRAEIKSTQSNHTATTAQLLSTESELEQFKADFQRKVREAQQKTKDRLDDLTLENTQLRKKFLSKSEEFSDYRASVESKSAKAILSYKEKVQVMLKARTRANLSIAMGLSPVADGKSGSMILATLEAPSNTCIPRPSSAPITKEESSQARNSILSIEHKLESTRRTATRHHRSREMTPDIVRPSSCRSDFRH